MTANYLVPAQAIETEYEIKKSRFIARMSYASCREEAMAALALAKKDYPDARHHCWAYLLGSPLQPRSVAMSDDGEPSGTAGKPILNVMQHKAVGDVVIIVVRYFGGIKLGAGGLVRAYSQAAQQAYDQVHTKVQAFLVDYRVRCHFAEEQTIRHWLSQNQGIIQDAIYGEDVQLDISLAEEMKGELIATLDNLKGANLIDE